MAKILKALKKIIFFVICLAIIISVPIISICQHGTTSDEQGITVMSLWQIDNFEGGRGSRASYIQNIADKYFEDGGCYINVISISADAARLNIKAGKLPDLISYGAGVTGIEGIVHGYTTWCYGAYCYLTLSEKGDFTDIAAENTVINGGMDNFVKAAALLSGLKGANVDQPTGAYVKLINGQYKYLLGTQRDIFRLKTRGVTFSVKPVTQFNDLYQNISIVTREAIKNKKAEKFIAYLLKNNDTSKIGLLSAGCKLYDDEMSLMEGLSYEYKLTSPISGSIREEIITAIENCDENKLKNLLK